MKPAGASIGKEYSNENITDPYDSPSFPKVGGFRELTGYSITTISAPLFPRCFIRRE
ncbi:hypothetical protein ACLQ28_14955 [Micromonospora sp. DT201]|uniref:hypothetical protein n=1 Tax=Micromonospora sp. DT201 TaxID=3393442 RepID=UPI003CEAB924